MDLSGFSTMIARAALAGTLFAAPAVLAQDREPPPGGVNPPLALEPVPDPVPVPGLLDVLGRWIGGSQNVIEWHLKGTQDALRNTEGTLRNTQELLGDLGVQATETARDAAGAVRDAAGVIASLPFTRMVTGRQRCALAPNGGVDCTPAANALCRAKGYGAGRGIEVASGQICPAWVWHSGRPPAEGECTIETYVTRAACQ